MKSNHIINKDIFESTISSYWCYVDHIFLCSSVSYLTMRGLSWAQRICHIDPGSCLVVGTISAAQHVSHIVRIYHTISPNPPPPPTPTIVHQSILCYSPQLLFVLYVSSYLYTHIHACTIVNQKSNDHIDRSPHRTISAFDGDLC